MYEIIGVQFQEAGKKEYFSPNGERFKENDLVVVESKRGVELGQVKLTNRHVGKDDVVLPLKEVIRHATDEDVEKYHSNLVEADKALALCKE
ncbi:signal peptidase II, partial [Gemella sp. 19428wG2_WT2a]